MWLRHLWLTDFRNHESVDLALPRGLTVITGANGEGKTNLLEGMGWLALLSSFRGVAPEAVVRQGASRAVVRGEIERGGGREMLIEAEVLPSGRGRVSVNRQALRRSGDLAEGLRVSVFSPDDLALVKEGPSERRRYLDDLGVALHPRHEALRHDYERVLRQRTTLLRQAGGRLTPDIATTLDVWDDRLVRTGEALGAARAELVDRLSPALSKAHTDLAGTATAEVHVAYEAAWLAEGLAPALAATRADEIRRGVSLVGPHRDDMPLSISGLPSRTHASQGEQRTLALALRLAAHHLVTDAIGEPPVLLLDDVFSELDATRSEALLAHLPPGQAVLTTTGAVPSETTPELRLAVTGGRVGPL